jgi:hypothetical protein
LILDGDHTYHADGYLVHNKVDKEGKVWDDSVSGREINAAR